MKFKAGDWVVLVKTEYTSHKKYLGMEAQLGKAIDGGIFMLNMANRTYLVNPDQIIHSAKHKKKLQFKEQLQELIDS